MVEPAAAAAVAAVESRFGVSVFVRLPQLAPQHLWISPPAMTASFVPKFAPKRRMHPEGDCHLVTVPRILVGVVSWRELVVVFPLEESRGFYFAKHQW